MECYNPAPYCGKPLGAIQFLCPKCKEVKYCSKKCRQNHSHKHMPYCGAGIKCWQEEPPNPLEESIADICAQIAPLDHYTTDLLNCQEFQNDMAKAYRMFLEGGQNGRFIDGAEWAILYISLTRKIDKTYSHGENGEKHNMNLGIMHWKDGNRKNFDIENFSFLHLCDAMMLLLTGSSQKTYMNLMDGWTQDETRVFLQTADFIWHRFGNVVNDCNIPIILAPPDDWALSREAFESDKFRASQNDLQVLQATYGERQRADDLFKYLHAHEDVFDKTFVTDKVHNCARAKRKNIVCNTTTAFSFYRDSLLRDQEWTINTNHSQKIESCNESNERVTIEEQARKALEETNLEDDERNNYRTYQNQENDDTERKLKK